MNSENLLPVVAIVFGFLILIFPQILNFLVGIFLIIYGLMGLGFLRK